MDNTNRSNKFIAGTLYVVGILIFFLGIRLGGLIGGAIGGIISYFIIERARKINPKVGSKINQKINYGGLIALGIFLLVILAFWIYLRTL